jgi:hypothetical protein
MLRSTKDHWRKIAEEEYFASTAEQRKAKQEEQNQKEWTLRYKQTKWLFAGVTKVQDENLNAIIEDKVTRDKRSKYIPEEEAKKKERIAAENAKDSALSKAPQMSIMNRIRMFMKPKERKVTETRVRSTRFVIKEGIAKLLVERDVTNDREKFLIENSDRIRMLQNVRLDLNRPRLPPHQENVSEMIDAEPPMSVEMARKYYTKQL